MSELAAGSERTGPTMTAPRVASREEFADALTAFINGPLLSRHGRSHGAGRATPRMPVDGATPLFATGAIDSLGILDLLMFVETVTGHPVPFRKVDVRCFGTIDRISESFWPNPSGGGHS